MGTRQKNFPAFDGFDLSVSISALDANNEFGLGTTAGRHFTEYSQKRDASGTAGKRLDSDIPEKLRLMNPMYHLRKGNPGRSNSSLFSPHPRQPSPQPACPAKALVGSTENRRQSNMRAHQYRRRSTPAREPTLRCHLHREPRLPQRHGKFCGIPRPGTRFEQGPYQPALRRLVEVADDLPGSRP
ncbi:hypothetical protein [Streptomyces sp. NBC_01356]|uniref:hypothetical protein n=1 Tax=Streptomyces sp. NBC_01356 TaxID=2903836 RepID=UPI002E34D911|nr:hypothetical protein [Streptomyces sp. NBC_01356]